MNAKTAIIMLESDAEKIRVIDPIGAHNTLEIASLIVRQRAALQSALNGFEYLDGRINCTAYINTIKEAL